MSLSRNGFLSPQELSFVGRKGGEYLLKFHFDFPEWDSGGYDSAWHYWRGRYFELKSTPHGGLYGQRGDMKGNLFASDIRKIVSEVLVEQQEGLVSSQVRVDFRFQVMTEWDLMEYKLEQLLFRQALLGRPEPAFMEKLARARFVSQMKWMFWTSLEGFPQEFTDGIMALIEQDMPWIECVS